LTWLYLNANLTLTTAVNRSGNSADSGKKLTFTPDNLWTAEIKLSRWNWCGTFDLNHTGSQERTEDNLIPPLPPYDICNASLTYTCRLLGLTCSVFGLGNNLFDKQYEIYDYVPQPGFNWTVGTRIEWKK